jgi:hypothetical protein
MDDIVFKKNHSKEYKEIIESIYNKINSPDIIDFSQFTYEIINCEFDVYIKKKIYLKNYTLMDRMCKFGYLKDIELLIEKEFANLNHIYIYINPNNDMFKMSCKEDLIFYGEIVSENDEDKEKIMYLINKFENNKRPNKLCRII